MSRSSSTGGADRDQSRSSQRWLGVLALVVSMWGAGLVAASPAVAAQCPAQQPTYNGPCGPTFTLPNWGDAAGWKSPDQYSTIQLADVLGKGRDQLIGRSAAGVEIWEFDTTVGQWRPALDAQNRPMVLTAFGDPPPLTTPNSNPPTTDWTLPQYYSTIQTGDVLGTGRAQILGRSATGVIVFSYAPGPNGGPGTWTQVNTGSFIDAPSPAPGWYQTIGTADLFGGPADELWGIDTGFNLRVLSWTGSGWNLVPGSGGTFGPGVQGNTLQASGVINGQQELWYETSQGMQGLRLNGPTGQWTNDSGGGVLAPDATTSWDQLPASATIRFAVINTDPPVGGNEVNIAGRSSNGLVVKRRRDDGSWVDVGVGKGVPALSDANGFNQEKYWRTITYADIDGDHRQEVLARGPNGVVAFQYHDRDESFDQIQLPASGSLDLEDDPWGGDQSYYGTFRAGDVDGDGHDDLIARGPYGIRTWFYNRPGQPGFGPYLPSGYPAFTGDQQTAYAEINAQATSPHHLLIGNQQTVRDIWSATKKLPTNFSELSDLATDVGNCGTVKQSDNPPQYSSCAPPSGSGIDATVWTGVVNQLLAEWYDAQQVVAFYQNADAIREKLFIDQNAELPAIGSKINLAGAANATANFDASDMVSGAMNVAAAVAGLLPGVGPFVAAATYIDLAIASMIPSATPAVSDTFTTTYGMLQSDFITAGQQADDASASLNLQVRSDRNLMRLVSQLSQPGMPWDLDPTGMESIGNQAFTLWVYKSVLPAVYSRYSISGCVTGNGNYDHGIQIFSCSRPPAGPWVTLGQGNQANMFSDIEPIPQGSFLSQSGSPCHEHLQGLTVDCAFSGPDAGIVSTISDPVSNTYGSGSLQCLDAWVFGCSLGVDADLVRDPTPILNSAKETWNFRTWSGTPIPLSVSASGSAGAATAAQAARVARAARGHTVRLAGTTPRGRRLGLRHASVAVDRVLSVPRSGRELVVRRASKRLGGALGPRTRRLGSIRLRQSSRGRFRSRESGRKAPRIRLKLTPRGRRLLAFHLSVSNVVIPRLSDVCGHGIAALRLTPRPFALTLRMRILRPHRRPVAIAATPHFACRYERSGAVRALRVVRPPRPPKLGRSLSVKLRHPRRLTAGRRGTLTATVRNQTSRTAHDVYIYAVVPRGLQVVGSTPRARITRRQVAWRVTALRRHRSRTLRLRVVPRRTSTAPRCSSVHVRARLRRSARATACINVGPALPPRFTG